MIPVYGLTLRGEKPPYGVAEWSSARIWVTKKQMNTIFSNQYSPDPEKRGQFYWVGERVFGLKDISYAKLYDYSDPKVKGLIGENPYLEKQLEREENEENGKAL